MKPATKKPAAKVADFLAEIKAEPRKTRCAVCDNKPVSDAIDEILAARKAGKTTVTAVRIHRWLVETYGVSFCTSTLLFCCRTHRGMNWTEHGK